jgi:hypothetical protein
MFSLQALEDTTLGFASAGSAIDFLLQVTTVPHTLHTAHISALDSGCKLCWACWARPTFAP